MWAISLLATLGTRRCRDNGDVERNGGLEDVEVGVGVIEVDGGRKWSPFWEIDGTLGLTGVENFVFTETDGDESCGDIDEFTTLSKFETEATRGLEVNVRWPRPIAGLGAAYSPVIDAFTFTETFEVTRMDGVGLGWKSRRLARVGELCMCGFTPGTRGDEGAVRDTPVAVGLGGWRVTLALRWRVTSSGEEALGLLVAFDSTTGRSVRVTAGLDEIDFCIPTACGFTEDGRVIEIVEVVVLGVVLFSARWFTLNGEGDLKETVDLGREGALGEVCAVLRALTLALEFILAFGRTTGDGEGTLLGDGGRLEIFRRGGRPFSLRGDGGRP